MIDPPDDHQAECSELKYYETLIRLYTPALHKERGIA